MNSFLVCEELNLAIDQMVCPNAHGAPEKVTTPAATDRAASEPTGEDAPAWTAEVTELLGVAADLRHLPRPGFKNRLMVELEWAAAGRAMADSQGPDRPELDVLPTLAGRTNGLYPVRGANMVASLGLHAALLLLLGSGFLVVKSTVKVVEQNYRDITLEPYFSTTGTKPNHGGGGSEGSGEQDLSKGVSPRFTREQLAPPLSNTSRSKLMVEATVLGPPELTVPHSQTGDPLSRLMALSTG